MSAYGPDLSIGLVDDAVLVDVPLPFTAYDVITAPTRDDVTALRAALAEALGHVEAGTIPPGTRVRAWRELAGTAIPDGLTPAQRAEDGIARAAARWTPEEVATVDAAIATIARRAVARWRALGLGRRPEQLARLEFTTADVWAELGLDFPRTKGIAGRMTAAKGAGIIASTGRTTYPPADAPPPNNGQRLTVWRAV